MKNSQKGFANVILIVAVIVLVGALGYVTLVKKSAPDSQQQVPNFQNPEPTVRQTTEQVPSIPATVSSNIKQSITVISPNDGGKLTMGRSYPIQWEVNTSTKDYFVGIFLVGSDGTRCGLGGGQMTNSIDLAMVLSKNGTCYNSGSGIPVTIKPGKYKIEASVWINGVTTIDESDKFFEIIRAVPVNEEIFREATADGVDDIITAPW